MAFPGKGGASFACWWSDRYTRGLSSDVSERRRNEIACDVFEQTHAAVDQSPGIAIAWRAARGVPSDLAWRRQEKKAMRAGSPDSQGSPIRNGWSVITQAWFAPIAVLLGVFNLLASYAVLTEDGAKAPGNVIGPIVMTTLAVSIFSGLWLRWRASRSIQQLPAAANPAPGLVSTRMIVALTIVLVVTLALLVVGVAAGSEPMFFIALALIGGTALGCGGRALARALRSSNLADKVSLADGMIIVGTLPAFGLFWTVIPPLMAIAVIIGIAGTGARFRHAA